MAKLLGLFQQKWIILWQFTMFHYNLMHDRLITCFKLGSSRSVVKNVARILMVNKTIFESFLYLFNFSASSHSFFSDQIAGLRFCWYLFLLNLLCYSGFVIGRLRRKITENSGCWYAILRVTLLICSFNFIYIKEMETLFWNKPSCVSFLDCNSKHRLWYCYIN